VISPQRASRGDSMVLTFAPPTGQPERTAVRAWSPHRAEGAVASGGAGEGVGGPSTSAAAPKNQRHPHQQQQQLGARQAARAAAQVGEGCRVGTYTVVDLEHVHYTAASTPCNGSFSNAEMLVTRAHHV
jgi:hypothetical protein